MFKRISLVFLCLFVARGVSADTLVSFADGMVTWEGSGVIDTSHIDRLRPPGTVAPPVGTPFTFTLSFNPSAAYPTHGSASPPGCMAVSVSGSLTLGDFAYTTNASGNNLGFTHAQLPGSNCTLSSDLTQFTLFVAPIGDDPWLSGPEVIVASYRDLFVQDAFPDVPNPIFPGWFFINSEFWGVTGSFALRAVDVEQPMPVPEPATLTMFGAGLAALVARRRRRQHH